MTSYLNTCLSATDQSFQRRYGLRTNPCAILHAKMCIPGACRCPGKTLTNLRSLSMRRLNVFPRTGTNHALFENMEKRDEREWVGTSGIRREHEIQLLSQIAQYEQIIRHLYITLNNAIRLLENVRPYVPNIIEWDNMLDHYYTVLQIPEKMNLSQKSLPSILNRCTKNISGKK